jgi:spore germination protein
MLIHVVQPNETIASIANAYNISVDRLILENDINPERLVIGQTIVIVHPIETYVIQEGDTLESIAINFNISIMELLRNNPYLADKEYLDPGETIVIRYEGIKERSISISGYAYPFIDRTVLKKTLPFLTYLTIFNYQITNDGSIDDIDDIELIQLAKAYGVAPIMLLSAQDRRGIGNFDIIYELLANPVLQNSLIDDVITVLKTKGYYGLNIFFQYLTPNFLDSIENYVANFSNHLRAEGFHLEITVTPRSIIEGTEVLYETTDYSRLSGYVDAIQFLSYQWGFSYGPPTSVTPVNIALEALNYIITTIPPNLIINGLPVIGYDWQLPYIPGYTKGNAITTDLAYNMAYEVRVPVQYNKIVEAPYFYYSNIYGDLHLVWFKDARSIDVISNIVSQYGTQGLSIWNIMKFFAQLWLIINVKYDIDKVPDL